jgi:hypothetical protein
VIVLTMARKPLEGTVAFDATEYGTGGINIDSTRIPDSVFSAESKKQFLRVTSLFVSQPLHPQNPPHPLGRWPSNVIVTQGVGGEFSFFCLVIKSC